MDQPRYKFPIQFSNSSRQLTPSLPGIAVRRTASLPLAYAGNPSSSKMIMRRLMDARIKPWHDECVCVDISIPNMRSRPRGAMRPRR